MARKDFAAMESRTSGPSGDSAARAALRSRMAHPTSLRLDEVQPNPLNPRYTLDDAEVVELADTLRRVGQLQPALVVGRDQFLHAYPDQVTSLGPQPWVVIVGNRRLAASRLAGRPALDVRVAADLDTAEDLEDRVLIENLQRKDLPPLLEAAHLQRRLARPGQTIRSVGEAIGKSHTYVQQRLDLLRMIPELQEQFRAGKINIRVGRQLGALPEAEQRTVLAGGPPYEPPDRSAAVTPDETAVGQVVSDAAEDVAAAGNQVSNGRVDPTSSAALARSGSGSAEPAGSRAADARDAGRNGAGPVSRPAAEVDLEATRVAVAQHLDSALARLDRALPAGADGTLGRSLAEARAYLQRARDALSAP